MIEQLRLGLNLLANFTWEETGFWVVPKVSPLSHEPEHSTTGVVYVTLTGLLPDDTTVVMEELGWYCGDDECTWQFELN